MRILSLIDCLLTGGGQHIMYNIVRSLPNHEHLIGYFYDRTPEEAEFRALLRDAGLALVPVLPGNPDWATYEGLPPVAIQKALKRVSADFRPHAILRHFWAGRETGGKAVPMPTPALISRRPRSVCVIHDHHPAPHGYDHYVPTSHDNDRSYQCHIPEGRKTVIYNGVGVSRFLVKKKPHAGIVIGRLGTLLSKKIPADYIDFLTTFDIPEVRFVFAGEGPRRAEFRARATELGCADRFEFLGNVEYDRVPEVLAGFDFICYVTDTHVETHSMAMIECAAAGLPIVAEPRGSLPEQIIHAETGFLASSREEIRGYCEELARDHALRERMGRAAREFGRQFTLERQALAYERLLESLVGRRWL